MVISIINQKGGVGKTATALNLGYELIRHGQTVTLIDLDSQRDLSTYRKAIPEATWLCEMPREKPSGIVIVDYPPRIDRAVAGALKFSDVALVPLQPNGLNLRGLLRMQRDLEPIAGYPVPIKVLLTMYSPAYREERAEIEEFAGAMMCGVIPRSRDIEKAQDVGQTVSQFNPLSRGASAYRALAKGVLRWDY